MKDNFNLEIIKEKLKNFNEEINIDKVLLIFAGFMILISVLLTKFHSPNWLWFTALIGINMIQSAITGFCPAVFLFKFLKIKSGPAFK